MKIKRFVLGDLSTNCYVVSDEKTCEAVVVDPAVSSERITKYIKDNNLILKYVLLTHGHFDHILGSNALADEFGAKVLISQDDDAILNDLNRDFTSLSISEMVKPDGYLTEGDSVAFGSFEFKVIKTPGHTPGGLAFYCDKAMFSGDTLFKHSIGRTDFYMGSFTELSSSIKKLYTYPDDTTVYPGHGFTTVIGVEKVSNPFVGWN